MGVDDRTRERRRSELTFPKVSKNTRKASRAMYIPKKFKSSKCSLRGKTAIAPAMMKRAATLAHLGKSELPLTSKFL